MRWMFTDEAPLLTQALLDAGEVPIVGETVSKWAQWIVGPSDYPLRSLAADCRADVVVIVNPRQVINNGRGDIQYGFYRKHVKDLITRRVQVVMLALNDPFTWQAFQSRQKKCTARLRDCTIYVTPDPETKTNAAQVARTVLWSDDQVPLTGIMGALQHARDRKVYNHKRDADLW